MKKWLIGGAILAALYLLSKRGNQPQTPTQIIVDGLKSGVGFMAKGVKDANFYKVTPAVFEQFRANFKRTFDQQVAAWANTDAYIVKPVGA